MPRPRIPDRPRVILDRARDLILERGYDATTMAEIASRAGIGKGAIYREFDSKEALLDALLVRSMHGLTARVRSGVEASREPIGLSTAYRLGLDALFADPMMLAFYTADARILGTVLESRGPSRYGPRMDWLTAYVRELQRIGLVRADLDPESASLMLSLVSVGLITGPAALGDLSADRLRDVITLLTDTIARAWECRTSEAPVEASREAMVALLDRLDRQLGRHLDGRPDRQPAVTGGSS
ncbi:MAG TPA: helix-turn-helix domain-containing protein [Actinopolymorphaceae bacterium]